MRRSSKIVFAAFGLIIVLVFLSLIDPSPTRATAAATQAASQAATPAGTAAAEPQGDPTRGKYLVAVIGCGGCHGAFKLATDKGIPLAGGNEFNLGPQLGTFYSLNLTNLQDWSFREFD